MSTHEIIEESDNPPTVAGGLLISGLDLEEAIAQAVRRTGESKSPHFRSSSSSIDELTYAVRRDTQADEIDEGGLNEYRVVFNSEQHPNFEITVPLYDLDPPESVDVDVHPVSGTAIIEPVDPLAQDPLRVRVSQPGYNGPYGPTEDRPVVSSVDWHREPGHHRIVVYNRGGKSGELTVEEGDGRETVCRLLDVDSLDDVDVKVIVT